MNLRAGLGSKVTDIGMSVTFDPPGRGRFKFAGLDESGEFDRHRGTDMAQVKVFEA